MLSIHPKLTSHVLAIRERAAVNMQSRIIFSLDIHNWCKWLDCNMGNWLRIVYLCCIPYRCKIKQPDTNNVSSFAKNTWRLLSMKMKEQHINSEVSRRCLLQKLSEN